MTSKYEDALDRIDEELCNLQTDHYGVGNGVTERDYKTIREALRKAESMDRLIEARCSCETKSEWKDIEEIFSIYDNACHSRYCDCELEYYDKDAEFVLLAASETAKYIKD